MTTIRASRGARALVNGRLGPDAVVRGSIGVCTRCGVADKRVGEEQGQTEVVSRIAQTIRTRRPYRDVSGDAGILPGRARVTSALRVESFQHIATSAGISLLRNSWSTYDHSIRA